MFEKYSGVFQRNKRGRKKQKPVDLEKKCQEVLFRDLKVELVYYDVATGKFRIKGNIPYLSPIFDTNDSIPQIIEKQKLLHPEFDFNKVTRVLQRILKGDHTDPLEFPLKIGNKVHWMKMFLVTARKKHGQVATVVGALQDVTSAHETYMTMYDFIEKIPGGLYRCCLTEPVRLEYVNEGFCEMLGYTKKEFDEKTSNDFIGLIAEEDRAHYKQFLHRMTLKPSSETAKYRMICFDGREINVADTMESIRSADGKMYGYSVVADITEYHHNLKQQRKIISDAKHTIQRKEEIEDVLLEERKRLAEELENLRIQNAISQMHPHFMYNTLGAIREIMLEDPEYASDLICDFTTYLRACIRGLSNGAPIPFEQELQNVKSYVNIEKMRMGDRLKVIYDIQDSDFEILSLSIQPIVENAIRHGIYPRGNKGGTLTIRTWREVGEHAIEVEDDGVGFDVLQIKKDTDEGKRDSVGLKNLEFRLRKK